LDAGKEGIVTRLIELKEVPGFDLPFPVLKKHPDRKIVVTAIELDVLYVFRFFYMSMWWCGPIFEDGPFSRTGVSDIN